MQHIKARGLSAGTDGDDLWRRCTRVLRMVHELHKAGYQHLRIIPKHDPGGNHWVASITPSCNVEADGCHLIDWSSRVAQYSSGQHNRYFGWSDAANCSARDLAKLFLLRFPDIMRDSIGIDWTYAGWLTDALGEAEAGSSQGGLVNLAWTHSPDYMARWTPPPPLRDSGRR